MKRFLKWLKETFKEANQNGKIHREVLKLRDVNAGLTEQVKILSQLVAIKSQQQSSDNDLKRVIDFFASGMAMSVADGSPGPSCPECGQPMRVTYDKGKFVASCLPCIGTRIHTAAHDAMINRPGNWQTDEILPLVHPYIENKDKAPERVHLCSNCHLKPCTVMLVNSNKVLCDECYEKAQENATETKAMPVVICMECFKNWATHELADSNNYKVCDNCYQDILNGH